MFIVFDIMAYEIGNTSAIEWRRFILSPRKDNLCTFDKKNTKAYHDQTTKREKTIKTLKREKSVRKFKGVIMSLK